eukprot:COSAG02_NODE_24484_length_687_cov_0.484694_1_plen_79_part_10
MTLIGILEFEKGTKLEYSDPNWNSWGWKALIGISMVHSRLGHSLRKVERAGRWIYSNMSQALADVARGGTAGGKCYYM